MDEPTRHEPVRRLVVELAPRVAQLLDDLVRAESLNKTTIVNRAVQLYSLIRDVQVTGGKVYIEEAASNEIQRLTLL